MNFDNVVCHPVFGRVVIDSWFQLEGDVLVGMGSKTVYDENGRITECSIKQTGVVMRFA